MTSTPKRFNYCDPPWKPLMKRVLVRPAPSASINLYDGHKNDFPATSGINRPAKLSAPLKLPVNNALY